MQPSDSLREQMIAQYDAMSPQLQQAARYVFEHPEEVALVSMREVARLAGVQPATMTRLAKFLGLSGYDELRAQHAAALRQGGDGFAAKVRQRVDGGSETVASDIANHMLQGLSAQLAKLCEPDSLRRLEATADRLRSARKIYVLGLRSSHAIAWHFHYVMTLLGERSVHLDGPGGTGGDALIRATPEDVMLVISIKPYATGTLELAQLAKEKGVGIVSITDSEVSPLVALSDQAIFCPTESDSFFHTLTPALAVSEVLCTLLAEFDRPMTLEALQQADDHLSHLNTYSTAIPRRQ
ncbi:MurR/RpiR family transcriptional regulator [Halomonas sp. ISL-60]|uniref:MurR/RpiR family transcriptional regulator n=1 Tax=Halomonas sp. ISL-56 TaxID=2819149 RepID=UPI001BECD32F|nr:MurR/RpiR family transcriptional regulator [Halomonas sp. ISL-56]MBT2772767.1 MurR/RpiR family transcriptional regulator [Halomonas sp. ISL-60]MBT2800562.1 MurR/RpiR family transcriptional regulator [Halomonas sp. ISL-56]